MRGLYEREDGTYYVRIPNGDGTYARKSLHTRDHGEAVKRAKSKLSAYAAGGGRETLWQDLAERFKREHFPQLKPGTRETYKWAIVALTPILFDKPVQTISRELLDKFVAARLADGLTRGGVRSELAVLSSMLGFAEGKHLIERNPVPTYIKANKRKVKRGEPRVRWLSLAEEARILDLLAAWVKASDKGPDARLTLIRAVIVAIDTGLRVSEIRQMEWSEISFERKEVYIPKERAKSGKDRWVPLLPRTLDLLATMREAKNRTRWVFPKEAAEGRQPGPRVNFDKALREFVTEVVAKAGIPKFSWHDLRRTCGCRLLQNYKLSMERVSKWLGHSSISVTERHYAFLTVDDLHEALSQRTEQEDNLAHSLAQTHRLIDAKS